MLNILYIGPNDSEWAQEHCPCSLAAAKWSRGFLTAVSRISKLTVLTHTYYFPWPKGRLLWSKRDDRLYPRGWDCEVVEYPVFRHVRETWWRFGYATKAKKIIREKNIDVVLIYNCYESWQVPVLRSIKAAFPNVRVIPIILDGDDPRKDNWGWMKRAAKYSDAFIALSWWIYQNIPANTGKPACHMDGGAEEWCGSDEWRPTDNRPVRLVHTGALDQWRGLDFMVEVVRKMSSPDVKFIFCGKSSCRILAKIFGDNPYVELPGFVEEEEMNRICRNADILLNVRDPLHPDNILNYPSKLPHYLSFGRPIVSTRLDSLSPDYSEVVEFADGDTVDDYIERLREVLFWDEERRRTKFATIKKWFLARKQWDVLVGGMYEWMKGVVYGQ